jgi:phosphatidyl-myo-inositol alpha-mannosyltransferase
VRIAHLTPTYWPEVTRGTERFVHDLATTLAARGHEVTILTSHTSGTTVSREEGVTVVRRRRPPELRPLRWYEQFLVNAPNALRGILSGGFDLAHAHFPSDAWAAVRARRLGGPPVVMTLHGIPTRQYLVSRRYRLGMLASTVREAAACTVGSEAAAAPFRAYMGREPEVIPPGVFVERFANQVARADVPTLVCAASLGDPRKRAGLLASAMRHLRRHRPEVRLLVFRARDPVLGRTPISLGDGVEWIEPLEDPADLARIYGASWASVLPAVEEAFGLVLTESLASGTPVVADRSGAGPEIINSPAIGRLFDRDDEHDLARAMDEALDLREGEGTRDRCRARALEFDWRRLVGRWERLYEEAA